VAVQISDKAAPFNPAAVSFSNPSSIAFDAYGNMYIADGGNNRVRKINPSGLVTTLAGNGSSGAGDGQGAAASFTLSYYTSLTADPFGNVYITDDASVRKISTTGYVTTIAGGFDDFGQGFASGQGPGVGFNPHQV
jgi:hypothetical protein